MLKKFFNIFHEVFLANVKKTMISGEWKIKVLEFPKATSYNIELRLGGKTREYKRTWGATSLLV